MDKRLLKIDWLLTEHKWVAWDILYDLMNQKKHFSISKLSCNLQVKSIYIHL